MRDHNSIFKVLKYLQAKLHSYGRIFSLVDGTQLETRLFHFGIDEWKFVHNIMFQIVWLLVL